MAITQCKIAFSERKYEKNNLKNTHRETLVALHTTNIAENLR